MEIKHILIMIAVLLLVSGCFASETVEDTEIESDLAKDAASAKTAQPFCGDGTCQAHENKCTCFPDCGRCAGQVDDDSYYECVDNQCVVKKAVDCGDGICDPSEVGSCISDCPSCDDGDKCTLDTYVIGTCEHDIISPCCGDGVCGVGEAALCIEDCGGDFDLSDYPEPFVAEGQLNTLVVIGSGAGAKGVVAGTHILAGLDYIGQKPGYTIEGLLDTDVSSISGSNVILVGNACMNTHVASLYKVTKDNCGTVISSGEQVVRLFKTGAATYALVVAGYNEDDVREAARKLENWDTLNLNGVEVKLS